MQATPSNQPQIFLNGKYLPQDQATLSINDRGTMFADGVYEVLRVTRGRGFEMDRHLDRLRDSLAGIELEYDFDAYDLPRISQQLVNHNALTEAKVYWQITRGPARRDHTLPEHAQPTVLVMADPMEPINPDTPVPTLEGALVEDTRWNQCWIKSLMLLPNVLAKNQARRQGADEAIFVRDGLVTEGARTNLFIVKDGSLRTHPADQFILPGITRQVVIELAGELNIPVYEQRFTPTDLREADEAFFTGTTTNVARLTTLHDFAPNTTQIHWSSPWPLTDHLHQALARKMRGD